MRYVHVVFTVAHALNGWVQLHPEVIHRLLFQAAWGTLQAFGRDPKRLDGMLGMTAVLHTWGQTLNQHVHLHCLVPGGALTDDGPFGRGRAFARAEAGFAHPWRAGLDVKGSNKAPVHGHNSRTHHRRLRRARVYRSVPPPPERYKTQIERAPA